jgi:hypothetical protein
MPKEKPDRAGWVSGSLSELPSAPPFPQLTEFEARALDCIAPMLSEDESAFRAQIATARVVDRINTGHGFYTRIEVDRAACPPAPSLQAAGADFEVLDVVHGVGVVLWDDNLSGYLATIEGFTYVDPGLSGRDLAALRFVKLA